MLDIRQDIITFIKFKRPIFDHHNLLQKDVLKDDISFRLTLMLSVVDDY